MTRKADYGLHRTILAGSGYYSKTIVHGTLVSDTDYNIHSVIGIPPLPGMLIAFKKYEICQRKDEESIIWKRRNIHYCRLVREYSQHSILVGKKLVEDPRFNTYVPALPIDDVIKIYDPFIRLKEIVAHPRDSLEDDAVTFLNEISEHVGLEPDLWGLTGSLLAGIHHPMYSDIDFIVAGGNYSEAVYKYLRNTSFPKIVNWKNILPRYSIAPPLLKILSKRRTRFLWKPGRIISVTFIDGDISHPKKCLSENGALSLEYNRFILDKIVDFEGRINIESANGNSLTYPPCAYSKDYIVLSFDHVLSPILSEEGCIYVKGQLARTVDGFEVILLGTKEKPRVIIKNC